MNEEPRPDWVVLGAPTFDGKVVVFASKDLTHAELTEEAEAIRMWSGEYVRSAPVRRELTVGMRTYVMVFGDTYEQAMRRLFDTWTPEPEPAAIAPVRPAIESRDEGWS